MKTIKNKEELTALLNEHKDLILPGEDVRIEYQVEKGDLRNVECQDLFLTNDKQRFDFNGWNFNGGNFTGRDFTGKGVSYWAFFNCYGSITCESIEGRRQPHAKPVCLDGKLTIVSPESETIEVNGKKYRKDEVEE